LVTHDTVYVTTSHGKIYALAADTGTQRWEIPVKAGEKAAKPFSALAFSGELLFVGSFDHQLKAIDPTNNQLWSSDLPKDTKLEKWSFTAQDAIVGAPAIDGSRLFVGSSDRNVYAIDATTGEKIWSYSTGNWVWATPLVAGNRIYVGSMDHNLYCLDAATGELKWKFAANGAIPAQAVLQDGVLYFGALDGKVYAVDAERGEKIWEFQTGNWVWSEPVIFEGTVIVTSIDHKVYALDARTGAKNWVYDTGSPVRAGAALADNMVYIVTDSDTTGQVIALDAAKGQRQWSKAMPKGLLTTPVVAGDVLYVVDLDGRVAALKRSDGLEMWAFVPPK